MLVTIASRGPQQRDLTLLMVASALLASTALRDHPGHSPVFQEHTTMQVVEQLVWNVQQVFTAVATLQLPLSAPLVITVQRIHLMPMIMHVLRERLTV